MHFVGDFRFVIHFYPVLLAFLIFPFPRLRVNHFLGLAHKWYPGSTKRKGLFEKRQEKIACPLPSVD